MNCKQGDLAVVVRSRCGNEGAIVRCVKFAGDIHKNGGTLLEVNCWHVDPPLPKRIPGFAPTSFVPDASLRPIRDNDSTDEMLRLVGLPNQPETV